MNSLLCPGCGQEVTLVPTPPRCPRCQAPLPVAGATRASLPSWFPGAAPAVADTAATDASPTQMNAPPASFPFLHPPRQPGEIGWLGAYRVVKVLGQGGMGIVFQAEDTHLQRFVALKVMAPEAARDPAARMRFLREARLTASLHSDHVVTVHQVGELNDMPFLAMELLQGETLAAWIRRGQRPTPAQILDLGLQVARGMEAAHAVGLIHRDVKPSNLWLELPSGRVKLLDFGLARLSQDASPLTQVGTVVGTPAYMAPEQAEGGVLDGRSDLFSLGCVLYEMAAGEPPFAGVTMFAIMAAMAVREPPSLRSVNPAFPAALSKAVMRLLAKNPADRPASAGAFAAELIAVADAYPALRPVWLSGSRPTHVATPGVSRRRFWLLGLAGGAGAAAAGGGAYLYFHSGRSPARQRATAQGVSEDRVLFGMTGPFTGSAAELGRRLEAGIRASFAHTNERGVAGRRLELVALDDGYDPPRALANVRRLDEEYGVFGFVGNVGAPTAEVTLPYALQRKMLFFGAFTGTSLLRKRPPDRYVFNYRPSLEEETAAAVGYLLRDKGLRPEEIAVFSQNDSYGDSGFRGVERSLRDRGRRPEQIVHGRYPRNTLQVEEAVKKILADKGVKAVVMVPTYRPAAQFIKQVRDVRPDTIFTSTAFVGSGALAEGLIELGPKYAQGVIVTQMTPPLDSHATLVLNYRKHLREHSPSESPNAVSLEGYLAAAVLTEGLRRAGDELTTETLVEALESIHDLDVGLGVAIRFSPSDHQAIHKVWAVVLDREGMYHSLDLD